jgi:hypothetical protein
VLGHLDLRMLPQYGVDHRRGCFLRPGDHEVGEGTRDGHCDARSQTRTPRGSIIISHTGRHR